MEVTVDYLNAVQNYIQLSILYLLYYTKSFYFISKATYITAKFLSLDGVTTNQSANCKR